MQNSKEDSPLLTRRRVLGLPAAKPQGETPPQASSPDSILLAKHASATALGKGAGNLIWFLKMHANSYSNDIGGQFLMKLIYGPTYNLRDPENHPKGSENYAALLSFFQRFALEGNRLNFTAYEEECLNAAYEVAVPETRLKEISITNNIKALLFNRRQMLIFGGVAALGTAAFNAPTAFEVVKEHFNGDIAKKYERIVDAAFEKAQKEGYSHDSVRIGKELTAELTKQGPKIADIASQVGVVMTLLVLGSQLAKVISKGYDHYENKAEYLIAAVHELCELHLDLTPVPPELWKRGDAHRAHKGTIAPPLTEKHK